ncbi:hypothetical protein ACIA49_30315 [Kribbella sp. NPDC051587]|uniref:hypothetical protein n=1 Tax=Kribbella sp. NPDC051587 TaxID=3364119 RepID=UPI0037B7D2EC
MSQVFGTPRLPAHAVPRTDRLGRAITLDPVLPARRAILFTGPPGMGKTRELDHAAELAVRQGWTTIRVEASAREPLEHRFTRAISADLGKLRREFGGFRVRQLRRTVRDLTQRQRKVQHGAEVRVGGGPVQFVTKRQWDATPQGNLGSTLNDVADQLGSLGDKPVLLLVDNVDQASPYDLAGLNELAVHLEQRGGPVWLVAAGGAMATSRLMAASERMSGIATTVTNQFDIRELGPMSDAELRSVLTIPLDRHRTPYESAGIDELVRAANGDPSRLRTLADAALELARPAITGEVAKAASARVQARSAVLYQGRWNKSSPAEKDLLARVAASNGLLMPPELAKAGAGRWQPIDQARHELVARGLLRADGERVTFADAGLQEWVNTSLGQIPSAPALPATPAPAVAVKTIGTTRLPVHQVDRKDGEGRPLSLDQRTPSSTTVLFTGAPGMGTSHELDRAEKLAVQQGWTSVRIEASPREPLENRLIRAISQDLDTFRTQYGAVAARALSKDLDRIASRSRNPQTGNEIRGGMPGVFQVVVKEQHDASERDEVGCTLNELADRLGELAAAKGEPMLLMVDNLDVASDRDLVGLTELSARLASNRQPVFLVAAGGELTTTRLLAASGGDAGVETDVVGRFDIRQVQPFTDAELRPALTEPLRQAAVPHEPEAVDRLVKAANGNPSRLRALATTALDLADTTTGLTTPVVKAATARLNDASRPLYEAAWHNCTPAEKDLLAKAAHHPIQLPTATTTRWSLESAATRPLTQGLLRATPTHLTIADPGLQTWLQTRFTHAALTPPTPSPPLTPNAHRTPKPPNRANHPTR